MYFSSFCQFWRFSVLGTEIWGVNLFCFFAEKLKRVGARYWLQSKFTYPLVCRNTRGNIIFSFSRCLARFSACERSQNWMISVFWWFPTIPRPQTIAENPESWEKNQNRLFRHINHLSTRVLTKYRTPDPLDLLGKKTTTWVTTQTANLKCAKRRLLHRAPDLGFPEIHPSLREDISELKRS